MAGDGRRVQSVFSPANAGGFLKAPPCLCFPTTAGGQGPLRMALCPRVSMSGIYVFQPYNLPMTQEGHTILQQKTGSEKFPDLHEVAECLSCRLETGADWLTLGCEFLQHCSGLPLVSVVYSLLGFLPVFSEAPIDGSGRDSEWQPALAVGICKNQRPARQSLKELRCCCWSAWSLLRKGL